MSGNPSAAAAKAGHQHNTRRAGATAPQHSNSGAAADDQSDAGSGDEGKAGDPPPAEAEAQDDDADDPAAPAPSGIDVANLLKEMQAMSKELKKLKKQQQQQPQQSLSLGASPSPQRVPPRVAAAAVASGPAPPQQAVPLTDMAVLLQAMQESQARQASQQLVLRSLGELPSFDGKGDDTTLIAHGWLKRAERFFAIRERALGIDDVGGDEARLLDAAYALQDDARRWYDALPQPPSTWPGFREAVKARFCNVPSERIRVDRLREFVEKAARLREKINVQGLQAFTARFAQLAGEVPDDCLTGRGFLELLARGLPQRYVEVVMREDAKKPTPPLHEVINAVLAKAAYKEQSLAYGGASSSPASAAPMNLDAISLAVTTFGWTREEAQRNLSDSEGWAPHDTNGGAQSSPASSSSGPASVASPTPFSISQQIEAAVLNALATHAKVGAGPAAREQNRSRRNAPSGMAKEIPSDLFEARKKAGLCCKCGIAKYEPGAGHNSRTCKAPIDKTTSVVDGRKKANF